MEAAPSSKPDKKSSSKKRKSVGSASEPFAPEVAMMDVDSAGADAKAGAAKKAKKTKKTATVEAGQEDEERVNVEALSPIAHPLADRKLGKRVLRTVRKGAKHRFIKRGVKEVVKALRKGEKGLVVMAGDISPMDVLTHIPLLAEENGSAYIFVTTKESLGSASSTKRPTSCVMISAIEGGSAAAKKKQAAKKAAILAADPTKAAKLQADEDEYTSAYKDVLEEVLRLNEKVSY